MQSQEGLSYDVVTRLRRREKEASPLQRLDPPDFYTLYRSTVETYKTSINEAKDAGDEERLSLLRNDLKRLQQRVREIYALRERKIAELAALKAGGGDPDVGGLASEEKPLFESFLLVMSDHRGAMLEFKAPALPAHHAQRGGTNPPANSEDDAAPPAKGEVPATRPKVAAPAERTLPKADAPKPSASEKSSAVTPEPATPGEPSASVFKLENTVVQAPPEKVVLLAINDLPPFSGVHRDYHVKKGDVFSVPRKRAEALVRMGAVVQVGN